MQWVLHTGTWCPLPEMIAVPLPFLCLSPNFSPSAALEIWPYDNKWEEFKTKVNYPETKELKCFLMERRKDLPKPWNHIKKKSVTNDPTRLNMGLCMGTRLWIEAQTSRNWATERQQQVPSESQKIFFFSFASMLPAERRRQKFCACGIKIHHPTFERYLYDLDSVFLTPAQESEMTFWS